MPRRAAAAEAGEPGPLWIWSAPAIGRAWPRRAAMAVPARQSVCEPADRAQLPVADGGAARAPCRRRRPTTPRQSFCLTRPAPSFCSNGRTTCCSRAARSPACCSKSTSEAAQNRCKVVIGTGINLASYPPELEQPATSLAAHGGSATPAAAFETLAAVTDAWLARWAEGVAFQTVRRAWLDRAGPTGRPLRVRLHGEEAEGTYAGLDFRGCAQAPDERWCRAPHRRRRRVFRHLVINPLALV